MLLSAIVDEPPQGTEVLEVDGLTAVLLPDGADQEPGALLLRQAAAVAALMDDCPAVLPVRAGTRVRDHHEVRELLSARHDEFREGLDRVRGCVEVGVRIALADDEPSEAGEAGRGDGRAYLVRRTRAWRRADDLVRRLSGCLALPGVRDVAVLACTPATVKVSVLVERVRLDAVRSALVDAVGPGQGDVVVAGPFPPYSFATSRPRGRPA